jgi:hypothetical protein
VERAFGLQRRRSRRRDGRNLLTGSLCAKALPTSSLLAHAAHFPHFPHFYQLSVLTGAVRRPIIVFRMTKSDRAAEPYLRTAEVADIIGVTKRTLKNWLRLSVIPEPARNPSNRYRRWTLEDVEAVRRFLKEREGEK